MRVSVSVSVIVIVAVLVRMRMSMFLDMRMGQSLQPSAVGHPKGGGGDQRGRYQLQIGLTVSGVPLAAEIQAAHGDHPHDGGM